MGSSGEGAAAAEAHGSGGEVPVGGGNRWPKQETLALLKIRFDMDAAFRDSNLKGPLWEEVSRKMAELGFQRSAKKCKEKFENVNKYHKRTKDSRALNPDGGKTYRFFDQLQAWDNTPAPPNSSDFPIQSNASAVPYSTSPDPLSIVLPNNSNTRPIQPTSLIQPNNTSKFPQIRPFLNHHLESTSMLSNSTSSSTSSDDEGIRRQRLGGKKRKWKDFFESLMKDLVEKQEELHNKFFGTLDKRERERMARDEAWMNQETSRINREHQLLEQERSISAAKDAALICFLQKVTGQSNNLQVPISTMEKIKSPQRQVVTNGPKTDSVPSSSSRWPKAQVEALIKLRTSLDLKSQENVPKGLLWEEISAAMGKLGYNRSSKRCKEKWENMNKYFKKVKDRSKKKSDDSKTCPYFHHLDSLHKERTKSTDISSFVNPGCLVKPNVTVPIMAWPKQQWPVLEQDSTLRDEDRDEAVEESDREEDEEEGRSRGYEIVANEERNIAAQ